jgi:hypothetical protein
MTRKKLQISLRYLLLLIAVFCVLLGLITSSASRQARAVRLLREIGCEVTYEDDDDDLLYFEHGPGLWSWDTVRRLLGRDYVDRVYYVSFGGIRSDPLEPFSVPITQEAVDALADLKGPQVLSLNSTDVTDDQLLQVSQLNTIEVLYLDNTRVSDVGIRHISRLPQLKQLDVRDVTNTTLWRINGGTALAYTPRVTDESLKILRGVPTLERLDVSGIGLSIRELHSFRQARPQCAIVWDTILSLRSGP